MKYFIKAYSEKYSPSYFTWPLYLPSNGPMHFREELT